MKISEKERFLGTVKLGPKGQIVIPKEVRDMFGLAPGSNMVLLADRERGIALHRYDVLGELAEEIIKKHSEGVKSDDGDRNR